MKGGSQYNDSGGLSMLERVGRTRALPMQMTPVDMDVWPKLQVTTMTGMRALFLQYQPHPALHRQGLPQSLR